MQSVGVKKLEKDAVIPKYQTANASGFDIHALEHTKIGPGETKLVRTGLVFNIPNGLELQIRPRSGVSLKTPLRITNSPGTVDSDYTGEVKIIVQNTSIESYDIFAGDRIAQGVICPVLQVHLIEVNEVKETERGDGGFGSTGK